MLSLPLTLFVLNQGLAGALSKYMMSLCGQNVSP